MKRYFMALPILIALALPCTAQNAFYDAQRIMKLQYKLSTDAKQPIVDSILALILKYKDAEDAPQSYQVLSIENIREKYNDPIIANLLSTVVSKSIINIESIPELLKSIPNKNTPGVRQIETLLNMKMQYQNVRDILVKMDSTSRPPVTDAIRNLSLFKKLTSVSPDSFYLRVKNEVGELQVQAEMSILDGEIGTIFTANKLAAQVTKPMIADGYKSRAASLILTNAQKMDNTQKIIFEQVNAARSGIPSQSEMIDAMAIYLANRVKLETTLTFFEHMKKYMKDDKLIRQLFPNTEKVLTSYASYQLPSFGSEWRQAFSEDFVSIPQKIATDESHYFANRFGGQDNLYFNFLQQAAGLATAYRQNPNIIDVIEYLRVQNLTNKNALTKDNVISDYINILSLINTELYSTGGKDYWISYTEFLRMSDEEFDMMLSLLKNRYPTVMKKFNVSRINSDGQLSSKEFKAWLSDIIYLVNQFQQIQNSVYLASDGSKAGNYWKFASSMFEKITSTNANRMVLKYTIPANSEAYIQKAVTLFSSLSTLYSAIEDKNFMLAASQTVVLIKNLEDQGLVREAKFKVIFGKLEFTANQNLKTFKADALEAINMLDEYIAAKGDAKAGIATKIAELQTRMNKLVQNDQELKDLLKRYYKQNSDQFLTVLQNRYTQFEQKFTNDQYKKFLSVMTFVIDVARTENSEDLSRVIASHAAPPGSYRVKRNSLSSWDINAYVGLVGGFENKNPGLHHSNFAYGLTAPIGISYSWGKKGGDSGTFYQRNNGKTGYLKGNAWSISVTMIDIGAVVKYRIGETSQDISKGLPYKLSFSQFISPATHLHMGIKNTPLTIFGGLQYLPQLRNLSNNPDLPVKGYSGVAQINGGIAFDLPLFHFVNMKN